MDEELVIQGRRIQPKDLALIGEWLAGFPDWNRTRLSRALCWAWNWRDAAGRLKDMACRTLLLKLEARGRIRLPPRRAPSVNGLRNQSIAEVALDQSPLEQPLEALQPLHVQPVAGRAEMALFKFLLSRHHYLGQRNCVGENLKYLVSDRHGRPLACLLFGSAAWQCRPRDAWIGWSALARPRALRLLTNNTRLLILPWVRVPHLATHLWSVILRRLSGDWQEKYGHPIYLVETFVQRDRFSGTCYRAAGWIPVGRTTGRGRNAPGLAPQGPVKEVFLKPLCADFRQRLGA